MKKLLEWLACHSLIEPKDVGTADITSSYIDVTNYGRGVFLARAGAVTAAKVLTVTPMQAKDTSGTDAKALGSAVTAAGAGGAAPAKVEIEFATSDLDHANGFKCVAVKLGIDEDGKLGEAWLVLGEPRYCG